MELPHRSPLIIAAFYKLQLQVPKSGPLSLCLIAMGDSDKGACKVKSACRMASHTTLTLPCLFDLTSALEVNSVCGRISELVSLKLLEMSGQRFSAHATANVCTRSFPAPNHEPAGNSYTQSTMKQVASRAEQSRKVMRGQASKVTN